MSPEDIRNNHNFTIDQAPSDSTYSPSKIKVIGVGGGGNNAINHMYNLGARNVTFIVANTDRQCLLNSPVTNRVLLGPNTLRGRGAGNDPEKARMAAEESAQEIDALFDDDTDMVFITAGMGGGTGTGASPVIARIARARDILTIGIVTIPFLFEGPRKILKALDGAKKMSEYVDALLVINNERLSEIYTDSDFLTAFGKADDILSMAAMSISEIVTCDGYINLDFNDVNTTLRDGGTAIISTGYGEGENRVTKAIEDALHSPLLRNTDILGSRKLLFNLYFSRDAEDKFKIDETKQITDFISNIDTDVDVIWGVAFDESLGNKVKFTILAAGFDVTIDDNGRRIRVEENTLVSTHDDDPAQQPGEPSGKAETSARPPEVNDVNSLEALGRMEAEYGEKIKEMDKANKERSYILLNPDQLDNEDVFGVLEQNPTFNRDKRIAADLRTQSAQKTPAPAPKKEDDKPANQIDFSDF